MTINEPTLYADGLITITPHAIVLHHYYFPFVSKTVQLNNVERIEAREPTMMNGKWRIWGSGGFGWWFPLDFSRPTRDRIFLLKQKGKSFTIGFTVKDSARVENTLRELHLLG
jgi:hypothetical protein